MTPRGYQLAGRDFLAARRHALLADEMRVGKTPQAILACEKLEARKVLVVCPAIAVEHWHREFQKWAYWQRYEKISVVSFDRARRWKDVLCDDRWDVCIVDECHFARTPDAQITQLIYGKDGLGWHSDRLWCLSGTPAPKHAGNLYAMLKAFGATPLSRSAFERRFCTFAWDGRITGTNSYRAAELNRLLEPIMLRRTRKQVAPEMPEIDFQFLEVEPVSQVDLKYIGGKTDAEIGLFIDAHGEGVWDASDRVEVAKAKALPLVENIEFALENGLLKQTVVFGFHKEPLAAVQEALVKRGIYASLITGDTSAMERTQIQDCFLAGKTQVVVANILAAGTAIDLSAASHGFFLELDWLPSNNLQAANRLVSMQKDEKVTFDVCTWPGSADDRVQQVLVRRMRDIKALGLA